MSITILSRDSAARAGNPDRAPSAARDAVRAPSPLPAVMLEPIVRAALLEDLGRAGDITTDAIVDPDTHSRLRLVARKPGVLAGLDLARMAFTLTDPRIEVRPGMRDGARLRPGDEIAVVAGPARGILTAERTALNLLCHLSGVASATAAIADAIRPYGTRVTCTRKTLPGMRALQKYAVRVGGGSNHRFGLDDAMLIKDNHVALAGGIRPAVERARAAAASIRPRARRPIARRESHRCRVFMVDSLRHPGRYPAPGHCG